MKVFYLLAILGTICAPGFARAGEWRKIATENPKNSLSLSQEIQQINDQILAHRYPILQLTESGLKQWYLSHRILSYHKKNRSILDSMFSSGQMPDGFHFEIEDYSRHGIPVRVILKASAADPMLFQTTVISAYQYVTWEVLNLTPMEKSPANLDESLYTGSPVPARSQSKVLTSVPVRITPVKLEFGRFKVDALKIEFLVTSTNALELASYLSNAYSSRETLNKLSTLLGENSERWISLDEILNGWISKWINHFPGEKELAEGKYPNDNCHGVARQFFSISLANGGYDRSTNATEFLLKSEYKLLPNGSAPEFGDYLYFSGMHSVRFILKDPVSGRWIGASAWSSQEAPYRLWWIDQDYTPPTGKSPMVVPIRPDFLESFDIWRRNSGGFKP